MPTLNVKIGRRPIPPGVVHHWAIKVGDTWYEIRGASKKDSGAPNQVIRSHGYAAQSGAGSLGGELVGETWRTDDDILRWIEEWLAKYPEYDIMTDNCQTFVFEMMVWLTNGNYILKHRMDAAHVGQGDTDNGLVVSDDGNAIARYCLAQGRGVLGPLNTQWSAGEVQAQAVAGPGFGVFVDATLVDQQASLGNWVGGHIGLNGNTGVGARNGNLEAHVLGFGGKIGADGVEINTPIGGVNACSVM